MTAANINELDDLCTENRQLRGSFKSSGDTVMQFSGDIPDITLSVEQTFGFESDLTVPAFSQTSEHVPSIDEAYCFDPKTTTSILAGFSHNKNVLIQGFHGTGKSTHIEQVAARLNWPCVRINLDSHVSRIDLIGKDAIILKGGKQVTEFKEGILPWSYQNPIALVLDEYDAGRPDVMFVIHRVLEAEGRLTLLDQSRVLHPHPSFRLFATANTIGLGDSSGLYHGTQVINQAQIDRWNIISTLNYLEHDQEVRIVLMKAPSFDNTSDKETVHCMASLAGMIRHGFMSGDVSVVMSTRTLINWAHNIRIFEDREHAFLQTFLNRCDELEKPIISEYYQRCFGVELMKAPAA